MATLPTHPTSVRFLFPFLFLYALESSCSSARAGIWCVWTYLGANSRWFTFFISRNVCFLVCLVSLTYVLMWCVIYIRWNIMYVVNAHDMSIAGNKSKSKEKLSNLMADMCNGVVCNWIGGRIEPGSSISSKVWWNFFPKWLFLRTVLVNSYVLTFTCIFFLVSV